MIDNKQAVTNPLHQIPASKGDATVTLRIPKPNMQVAVLGLVAFITLFQTFQLIRIGGRAGSTPVKSAPAAVPNTGSGGGTGGGADVPQSMVGGC